MIKKVIFEAMYVFLRIFGGKAFSDRKFQPHKLLKYFIWQKIFRINGHVPWPVHKSTKVIRPENIDRGDRCPGFAMNVHIDGRNGITFGSNVWVGPRVSIISMNHDINDYHSYKPEKPIKIGDDCWLGVNAVILPGVELGNHVVVGAGSIVTKSFGDNVLIGGNPAKVIKELTPYGEG